MSESLNKPRRHNKPKEDKKDNKGNKREYHTDNKRKYHADKREDYKRESHIDNKDNKRASHADKREYHRNNKRNWQEQDNPQDIGNIIYGRHSVLEALKANRTIDKILVQQGETEGSIKKIIGDAKKSGILVQEVDKVKLDTISNYDKHQGVVAYVAAHMYYEIDDMLNDAQAKQEDPFLIILDNIQDPHNLGAIIRTAHACGAHGVIIPKHRAVGLTAVVSKASAGALEHIKIAKVTNIAQTVELLKTKNIWIACADMDGEVIFKENLKGPIGVIIGNEGEGISKNVKSKADFIISIPMHGKVASLNASVAAAIMCYEVVRQRAY
ncbi:MAG: 23S rRNA (guanosine(2251)-2'-O)-methyltransferase RlmB [Epulopiscium sp. Nuni2H_MBin001]|nr:MAG: 23S rRNA (guanosine(2251)-2'-O)-methyltransferase RlmB [Epulopiscium sp. Nuni2H_MBin001]